MYSETSMNYIISFDSNLMNIAFMYNQRNICLSVALFYFSVSSAVILELIAWTHQLLSSLTEFSGRGVRKHYLKLYNWWWKGIKDIMMSPLALLADKGSVRGTALRKDILGQRSWCEHRISSFLSLLWDWATRPADEYCWLWKVTQWVYSYTLCGFLIELLKHISSPCHPPCL